ncbi:hypothetical protein [Rhizobium sp. C4]|uniref:hypothetical protein n=1 Tax=Rhizobium sp. C4 TaxID=1349800 RepID=UPI001E37710E|nr:hypothetical protein [Rhizobium sp. C4]MCD2175340.1 hypothetical protein [Rhizobium sp. C4]
MPTATFETYLAIVVELGDALAEKKRLRGNERWKAALKMVQKDGGSWGGYMNTPPGSVKPLRCVSRRMHDEIKAEALPYFNMYPTLKDIVDRLDAAYIPYAKVFRALDSRKTPLVVGATRGPAYERAALERVLSNDGTSLSEVRNDLGYWFDLVDRAAYQDGRLGHRRRVMTFGRSLIETLTKNPEIIVSGDEKRQWLLTHILCRTSWRAYLWGDRAMEDYCVGVLHNLLREFPDFVVHSRILAHVSYHDKKSTAPFVDLKAYDAGVKTCVPKFHHSIGASLNNAAASVIDIGGNSISIDDRLHVLGDRTIREALDLGRAVDENEGDLEGAAMCTRRYAVTLAELDRDYDGGRRAISDIRTTLRANNFSAPLAEVRLIQAEADICEAEWKLEGKVSSLVECGVLLERAAGMAEHRGLALSEEARAYRERASQLGR